MVVRLIPTWHWKRLRYPIELMEWALKERGWEVVMGVYIRPVKRYNIYAVKNDVIAEIREVFYVSEGVWFLETLSGCRFRWRDLKEVSPWTMYGIGGGARRAVGKYVETVGYEEVLEFVDYLERRIAEKRFRYYFTFWVKEHHVLLHLLLAHTIYLDKVAHALLWLLRRP